MVMNLGVVDWFIVLVISELVLISVVASVYYFFIKPGRNANKTSVEGATIEASENVFSRYFTKEIERTFELLSFREGQISEQGDFVDFLPLKLRGALLNLEKTNAENEPNYLEMHELESMILDLLNEFNIISALQLQEKNGEYVDDEYREIIDKQSMTIEFLKKYANEILVKILKKNEELINNSDSDENASQLSELNDEFRSQTQNLMSEIKNLETNNVEMNQCISVLEEENQFLRKQIEHLLK